MKKLLLTILLVFCLVPARAGSARACGGVVTTETSVALQTEQRVFISLLEDGTSHIVLQLRVPEPDAPFGALTPVSGLPTLNPNPVDTAELDELEENTRPSVWVRDDDSGDAGCSCEDQTSDSGGGSDGFRVGVVEVVDIGPVTAVVLSAKTSADLLSWLADNDFVLPAASEATLDAYIGDGKYFIAFKRSKQASGKESSVGVSYSVPGDQRGYPLRMSRIGAGAELGIQVFIAAPGDVSPTGSAPIGAFAALSINHLYEVPEEEFVDPVADYTGAVRARVAAHGGKAFVIENVFLGGSMGPWRGGLGPNLSAITESGQVLTRLVTVMKATDLDRDVSFTGDAPRGRHARRTGPRGAGHLGLFGAAVLGLVLRRGSRRP